MQSSSLKEAQVSFINYINKVSTNDKEMKECIPVLVGHNAMTFDISILLRTSFPPFMTELKRLNVHFGDSLILAKQILKEKHPALRLSDFPKPRWDAYIRPYLTSRFQHTMPSKTLKHSEEFSFGPI